jgi:hypothetical protein
MDIPAWQAAKRPSQGSTPMTFPQMRLWVSLATKIALRRRARAGFAPASPYIVKNYITFLGVFQLLEEK